MIVGLVGFASSGKDTVAEYLAKEHGFTTIAFADSIKDCLATIFCWDREMLEGKTKESRKWREEVDNWWADKLCIPQFSPRWAMTNFGTDLMRRHFNPDIWIINTLRRLEDRADENIVLRDCRFPNEIEALRSMGARIFNVRRGEDPEWYQIAFDAAGNDRLAKIEMARKWKVHESEWAWMRCHLDGMIENSCTLANLHRQVDDILTDA